MGRGQVKIKIFGRDGRGWSIDQDYANAAYLLGRFGYEITSSFFSASHIYCVWLDLLMTARHRWIVLFCRLFRKKLIAVATNDLTSDQTKLAFIKKNIDICIAPSSRVEKVLIAHGIKTVRIPFFVQPEVIKKLDLTKDALAAALNLDSKRFAGRVIIGSFQRDSLGADLTKPKWQKNPEHLVQILKQLPQDKFVLLLAGPRRHYLIRRCREESIPYIFCGDPAPLAAMQDDIAINTLPLETVNQLYNLCDVYVVSSKSEGGPKAVLEAASVRTLVISTDVGLAADILHPDLILPVDNIERPVQLLRSYLQNPSDFEKYIEYNKEQAGRELSLEILKEQFTKLFSV
jgi:glycosyltransferase involved in cell wall biosynthesis